MASKLEGLRPCHWKNKLFFCGFPCYVRHGILLPVCTRSIYIDIRILYIFMSLFSRGINTHVYLLKVRIMITFIDKKSRLFNLYIFKVQNSFQVCLDSNLFVLFLMVYLHDYLYPAIHGRFLDPNFKVIWEGVKLFFVFF